MLDRDVFASRRAYETATRHRITMAHLANVRPRSPRHGYSVGDVRDAMRARTLGTTGSTTRRPVGQMPKRTNQDRQCVTCGVVHLAGSECFTLTPGLPPGVDTDVPV